MGGHCVFKTEFLIIVFNFQRSFVDFEFFVLKKLQKTTSGIYNFFFSKYVSIVLQIYNFMLITDLKEYIRKKRTK